MSMDPSLVLNSALRYRFPRKTTLALGKDDMIFSNRDSV